MFTLVINSECDLKIEYEALKLWHNMEIARSMITTIPSMDIVLLIQRARIQRYNNKPKLEETRHCKEWYTFAEDKTV